MIDFGFSDANAGLIRAYFLAMIGVVAVLALASGARYYLVMTLGERVVADLRADLFTHLTRLDPSFFDAEKTGDIASRLSADTTQLKATFGSSASLALRNLFLFVGAIAMMVVTSPKLSAFVLAAIPVIVLPLYAAGRSVRQRSRRAQDRLADATAFATESLSAVRVMQSFLAERFHRRAAIAKPPSARMRLRGRWPKRARSSPPPALFLAFGSVVVVLWLGAQEVITHRMTGGALSQFVLFAVFGAGALGQLSEVWNEVSQAAGAAGRIGEILAVKPRIVAPAEPLKLAQPARGELAFRDVSFAYPGREDDPVLREASFRVAPGETVAIVGPSGAGKSTLFQLALSVLRSLERRGHARRGRHLAARSADLARRDCARAAGRLHLRRERGRQHCLWRAWRDARGDRRRREASGRGRFRLRPAAGLRYAVRRARRHAVGRGAPAHRHRPRHPQECAGAAARRGDLGARRGERNPSPGRVRTLMKGRTDARHRAPAGDDRQRRPHPCHRGGPPGRGRAPTPR